MKRLKVRVLHDGSIIPDSLIDHQEFIKTFKDLQSKGYNPMIGINESTNELIIK